jgi:hypothetical protein
MNTRPVDLKLRMLGLESFDAKSVIDLALRLALWRDVCRRLKLACCRTLLSVSVDGSLIYRERNRLENSKKFHGVTIFIVMTAGTGRYDGS